MDIKKYVIYFILKKLKILKLYLINKTFQNLFFNKYLINDVN